MSWSGLQREALEAMGFAVLLPRHAAAAADAATPALPASAVERAGFEATRSDPAGPQRARPEPAASHRPVARGDDATAASAAPSRPASASPTLPVQDRLARALLRAAGRAVDAADADALLAQWPQTDRLRRDPAAKRALWPRLRALRRAGA